MRRRGNDNLIDSGIDWIGKVPSYWKITRVKRVSRVKSSKRVYENQYCDTGVPFYRSKEIVELSKNKEITVDLFISNVLYDSFDKRFGCPKTGDLLITSIGTIGEVWVSDGRKFYFKDGNITLLEAGENLVPKFIMYCFKSNLFKKQYKMMSEGSTLMALSIEKINRLVLLLPPIREQHLISNFLDKKTTEIDDLIADKEKMIELLEEKRQAVITEAVTKGLDRNVNMKVSGVEWIGEVPEHWEVSSVSLHFMESKEKNVGNRERNVLSLSYGKIKRRDVESNFGLLPESFETYRVVKSGDIVLRLTDLQNDKKSLRVGLVKENGIITSAYLTLIPNENISSEYASLLFHAYDLLKVFYGLGSGVRQSIGYQDFKKLPILLPSKKEQIKICDYLNGFLDKLDGTIEVLKVQIDKLKEYRQSLIDEAVTGKVDVREYAGKTGQQEVW